MSQWPKWLSRQYGKLEICGSGPGYDTNFSLKNYHSFRCIQGVHKHRQRLEYCAGRQTDYFSRRNPYPEAHGLGAVVHRSVRSTCRQ